MTVSPSWKCSINTQAFYFPSAGIGSMDPGCVSFHLHLHQEPNRNYHSKFRQASEAFMTDLPSWKCFSPMLYMHNLTATGMGKCKIAYIYNK